MAKVMEHNLSNRGWSNVEAIMPRIQGAVAERMVKNNSNIDLSTAENWLIRSELIEICKDGIDKELNPKACPPSPNDWPYLNFEQHLSYPRGFAGDPDLLDAYSGFFNNYFNPHIPVESSHLATAPGGMAALDALLYNICDPGDGVLMPGPYWSMLAMTLPGTSED